MKFAVVLAFGLAAAPLAYAQQQGTNPGNTKKDADTADAQRNAPSGQDAVDQAKHLDKQQKARAQSGEAKAPAGNQELSTEQVRQEKKKAMVRSRAMKQKREEKGTTNWNTVQNPKTDQASQSGSNASGVSQPASSSGAGSGGGAGGAAGSGAPASGGSGR
jgi:hypothetical protein